TGSRVNALLLAHFLCRTDNLGILKPPAAAGGAARQTGRGRRLLPLRISAVSLSTSPPDLLMSPTDFAQALQQTLSDRRLSRSEQQALAEVLEQAAASQTQRGAFRALAFQLA